MRAMAIDPQGTALRPRRGPASEPPGRSRRLQSRPPPPARAEHEQRTAAIPVAWRAPFTDSPCPRPRPGAKLAGVQSPTDTELRDLFATTRSIAILGANTEPGKPACYVPDYLAAHGFAVYPVNPGFVGRNLWGHTCVATLHELEQPIDLVDVFRRPDALMPHVPEILAMRPLPKLVWLQLGIRHGEFARTLRAAGIRVIEDRCTLAEHRRLLA